MTYAQAKLAAHDFTITDWRWLHEASVELLARVNASDEDILDATDLSCRAASLRRAR